MNSVRPIISAFISLVLLIATFFVAKSIAGGKPKQEQSFTKLVKQVYVDTVVNSSIPLRIAATGNIEAKRKIELFAEVQGVFKKGSKEFKEGQSYAAGSNLISIDNAEYKASLLAARSNYYSLIASIMPDLSLDYQPIFAKWQNYLNSLNVNNSIPSLPSFETEQEKYFISNKGILNSYYNIKNMEERLVKYQINAPFSGVLTQALVNDGALIRAGQKLGEFTDPSNYELVVAIDESFKDLLKIGNKVQLNNLDKTKTYVGTVARINSQIDASTQSLQAFIEVAGKDLTEGMYLEANLKGKNEDNVYEISRKLLLDNKEVYAVKDSLLVLQTVTPIFFTKETAIVKGIPNGTVILNKSVPGAHSGMLVQIIAE